MRPRVGRVDYLVRNFGHSLLPDHRPGEPLGIVDVVEAEAALDAKPILVRRAVVAGDVEELVVLDLIGELAADATIGANAIHAPVGKFGAHVRRVHHRRRHQRAGGTGLHALAAGHARGDAHGGVEVEHDLLVDAAAGHADYVVDLHLAASTHTEIAVDAGIEVHGHCGMAAVGRGRAALGEAAHVAPHAVGPRPEPRLRVV